MSYDIKQIARELVATAEGKTYYGNALYVAQDCPLLSDEQRWVIWRWLDGSQGGLSDTLELHYIAHIIAADWEV